MPLNSRNLYDDIIWASACTALLFKVSTSDKCTQICYSTPCCGGDPAACQDPCDQALEDDMNSLCADYAAANTGTTCLAQCASARFTDVLYRHRVVYGISVLDCCSKSECVSKAIDIVLTTRSAHFDRAGQKTAGRVHTALRCACSSVSTFVYRHKVMDLRPPIQNTCDKLQIRKLDAKSDNFQQLSPCSFFGGSLYRSAQKDTQDYINNNCGNCKTTPAPTDQPSERRDPAQIRDMRVKANLHFCVRDVPAKPAISTAKVFGKGDGRQRNSLFCCCSQQL